MQKMFVVGIFLCLMLVEASIAASMLTKNIGSVLKLRGGKVEDEDKEDGIEVMSREVHSLTLEVADIIATAAVQTCMMKKYLPITVVVLDEAGHTIVSKRMDGCSSLGYPEFAAAKAKTAIITKHSSRTFRDKYTKDKKDSAKFCQMLAMCSITQGNMAPFPGGVVLKSGGEVVGAVGVSGAAADEDELCALWYDAMKRFPHSTSCLDFNLTSSIIYTQRSP